MKVLDIKEVINKSGKFTKTNDFTITDTNQASAYYTDFSIAVRCKSSMYSSQVKIELRISSYSNDNTKTHYYAGKVWSSMPIRDDAAAASDILNAISEKVGLGRYNYTYDLHYHI